MSEAEEMIERSKARAEAAVRAYMDCLVPPRPYDMGATGQMSEHVADLIADLMHLWHGVPDPDQFATDPPRSGDDWVLAMTETAQRNFAAELADALPGGQS